MFTLFRNPPIPFLAQELEPLTRWVCWLAQACPRLQVETRCQDLGNHLYRVELVIDNAGWLPTYGSQKALNQRVVPGIKVLLTWPGPLLEGKREQEVGQLEGVSGHPVSPLWSKGDYANRRTKVSWVVQACQPGLLGWQVQHERAGCCRGHLTLGGGLI